MNEAQYKSMFEAEDSHWWYASLHELVLGYLRAEHTRKGLLDMLDAGCGTGRLCQLAAPLGNIRGCDMSETASRLAGSRDIAVFPADLNDADLGQQQYDVIASIDVLYHQAVTDELKVLRKFHGALRPGGMLILQMPAYEWLRSSHDAAVHTRKRYVLGEVRQMLTDSGFLCEKMTYRVSLLMPIIAAVRLARNICLGRQYRGSCDVKPYPPIVNCALKAVMKIENALLGVVSLPFGASVFAVARRPL